MGRCARSKPESAPGAGDFMSQPEVMTDGVVFVCFVVLALFLFVVFVVGALFVLVCLMCVCARGCKRMSMHTQVHTHVCTSQARLRALTHRSLKTTQRDTEKISTDLHVERTSVSMEKAS